MGEDTPEKSDFLDKKKESEASFWRLKKSLDKWREDRVKRVLAQEGESVWMTIGRPLYISGCVLFDGPVMLEIVRLGDRETWAWMAYITALYFAIKLQMRTYDKIFSVDISQVSFESP
tara:strand:- start:7707 stop:8060 length:354 start_codon:yes stop_codon:yes gene_type:complete